MTTFDYGDDAEKGDKVWRSSRAQATVDSQPEGTTEPTFPSITDPGSGAAEGVNVWSSSRVKTSRNDNPNVVVPDVVTPDQYPAPLVPPWMAQLPPSQTDLTPEMVSVIQQLQESKNNGTLMAQLQATPQDILQLPEMIPYLADLTGPFKHNVAGSAENIARYPDSVENALTAMYTQIKEEGFAPVTGAALGQPNVSVLMKTLNVSATPEIKDITISLLSALPSDTQIQRGATGNLIASRTPSAGFFADIANTIKGGLLGTTNPNSPTRQVTLDPRNYREELAADLESWARGKPLDNPEARKDYIMYAWGRAKQLQNEQAGRAGHIGAAGILLDIPKNIVTHGANEILNSIVFPNDDLNRAHISIGKNAAYAQGFHITDEPGTSFLTHDYMKPLTFAMKYGVNALPGVAILSAVREASGGSSIGTPLLGSFLEGAEEANNFEMVSGAWDASSYLWADPINYAAGFGFGRLAVGTIPRAANISRGRLFLQALVPFYGVQKTGVRWGLTSRVTYALGSNTVGEMRALTQGTRRGNLLINTLRTADSAEEAGRLIPELANNPITPRLMAAAKDGDDSFVYDVLESSMLGWNERGNLNAADNIRGHIAGVDTQFHARAQEALDSGKLGIRDVMNPGLGAYADSVVYDVARSVGREVVEELPEIVQVGAKVNPEVAETATRNARSMADSPIVERSANAVIRKSGNNYGAFDKTTGDVLGSLSIPRKEIGVTSTRQSEGIGSALRRAAIADKHDVDAILGSSDAVSQGFVDFVAAARANDIKAQNVVEVLRGADDAVKGDGATRVLINGAVGRTQSKLGWIELDGANKNLVEWLHNAGNTELAQKVAIIGRKGVGPTLDAFTDDELRLLQRFANMSDADALRFGDDLIVGNSSRKKLLRGVDAAEETPIESVLASDMSRSASAMWAEAALGGKTRELMIVSRMPRVSRRAEFAESVARWSGLSSNTRTAQWARRFARGMSTLSPGVISFTDRSEGSIDLGRSFDMMGVSKVDPKRAKIMDRFWKAGTDNERRTIIYDAFQTMGDVVHHPKLKYELQDFPRRSGVTGKTKNLSGIEAGLAEAEDGVVSNRPVLKALQEQGVVIPDIMAMRRELGRYAKANRLPNRIIAGTGKTTKKRKDLVAGYRSKLTDRTRSQVSKDAVNAMSDDELMAIAYADVTGTAGRENGLGKINHAMSVPAGWHASFVTAFSIAQLAFRPFAWMSRVNLEEHARAWMMGLPTLIRNPAQYAMELYDVHWLFAASKKAQKQRNAAVVSSYDLFSPSKNVDDSLKAANEMLPGWSAKVEAMGIDPTDTFAMRVQWGQDLGNALGGGIFVDINSRGNLAQGVIRRQAKLEKVVARHEKIYGLDPREFDIVDDVPEMLNKFNTFLFADESVSSIKDMDFVPNLRATDRANYGAGWGKKAQQISGDYAGNYVIKRWLEQVSGNGATAHSVERFKKSQYWREQRANVEDMARYRQKGQLTEDQLVEFYLDEVLRDDVLDPIFAGLWQGAANPLAEKQRILSELAGRKTLTVNVGDNLYSMPLDKAKYADGKPEFQRMFQAQAEIGNYNFPTVSGVFHPLYASTDTPNPFRRFTNSVLEIFGERVSQNLHRRPSYMGERRRVYGVYTRLGWSDEDAASLAHRKAFETVNYTFFNNQHTGATLHRMNKVIPFFSAWAEVIGTWAWKIPSQNYLPLGYARMIRRMDVVMQSFVKLGLVEISDSGQWYLNLQDEPSGQSAIGRGLSKAGIDAMRTPVTIVEHTANIARMVGSGFDPDEFEPVDFSAWKKDDYQLAIGSPVAVNSHGVMGVNQFQFGLTPDLSFLSNEVMKRMPFAGDTELVTGTTLNDMYEKLPPEIGHGQFIEANKRVLEDHMSTEQFDLLFDSRGQFLDPTEIDVTGLSLQVPGSSWADGIIEDMFYPFGAIDSPAGVIRSLVPGSFSYIFRGLGLFDNDAELPEGLLSIITGPMEEYQIAAEVARQMVHLEATEGLTTKSRRLSLEMQRLAESNGHGTPEEMLANVAPGSPGAVKMSELASKLEANDTEHMKRATDNAAFALIARGAMGFTAPASPRMALEEQRIAAQWWGTKQMAEAAEVRGSLDWATALNDTDIRNEDDMIRMFGLVGKWLEDPSGTSAKVWFRDQYPSLQAWLQPVSFYGPAGAPGLVGDVDTFFDQMEDGTRSVYPKDVQNQRVARAAVDGSYESLMRHATGVPMSAEQGVWALTNWGEYSEMRDTRRLGFKSLDVWDDTLNGGAYLDWRGRNLDDPPSAFELVEEQMFLLQDAADEIFVLTDLADVFEPGERLTVQGKINSVIRNYSDVLRDMRQEIAGMPEYRNERDELIGAYFEEIVAPFYEAKNVQYEKLKDAETSLEQSLVFEEIRKIDNAMFSSAPSVDIDGTEYAVPNELQRAWQGMSDKEREVKILRWTGRPSEWLSQFAVSKVVEKTPAAAQYMPVDAISRKIFDDATLEKRAIRIEALENVETISVYERNQSLKAVDEQRKDYLIEYGYTGQAQWLDAWPIERLMLTGQLDPSLMEIGEWYLGIKQQLLSNDPPKGPGSQLGREYFVPLSEFLDTTYFPRNKLAEDALEKLGIEMFGEGAKWSIYARLYGDTYSEVE